MRIVLSLLLVAVASTFAVHMAASAADSINTGGSRLSVPGGEIWYRVVGGGVGTPLILVHGGPGLSSGYLKSMEALGDERLVVRYDQLGGGKSTVVTDTSLFNVRHFVEELDSLRRHLGFERVHLYGHSWGSILALEYYRAHPEHVASLTLASEVLDMPGFFANMRRLASEMPDSMSRALRLAEAGQPYDTTAFRAGSKWMSRHTSRKPVQADSDTMWRTMNQAIAEHLNGTSLFEPGNGTLADYDATPFLRKIRIPVLFLVGEFDFVSPARVKRDAQLTPGARFVMIPDAAHMMPWDNAPAHNDAVRAFLRGVDAGRQRPVLPAAPRHRPRGAGS